MPFARRRPLLRAAAVGGVAYMGSKRERTERCSNRPPRNRRPPRHPRHRLLRRRQRLQTTASPNFSSSLRSTNRVLLPTRSLRRQRRRSWADSMARRPGLPRTAPIGWRPDRSEIQEFPSAMPLRARDLARPRERSISSQAAPTSSNPLILVSLPGSRSL